MSEPKFNLLLLSYQGGLAGSTKSISFLADGLANRGHGVWVGCRKGTKLWHLLEHSPAQRVAIDFQGKWDPPTWAHIERLVKAHQIQIINAQSSKDRYASVFARWFKRLPCLVYHTRRQRPASAGGWLHRRFYIRGTTKMIVVSEGLKQTFIEKGYPADHLHVIRNGTPAQQYEAPGQVDLATLRGKYDIPDGATVIGCISRWKKQTDLLEALHLLPEDYVVFFAGFKKDIAQPFLDELRPRQRIIFAGELPFEEALACYRLFTVSVLCSIIDGFGLVLVEAMAMGAPVIATNAHGIKDVVQHGENGLLYDYRDVEQLAGYIRQIVADEALAAKFKTNGHETAYETFAIERTIDGYEQFFQEEIRRGATNLAK